MRINGIKCRWTEKGDRNTQIPCAIHRYKKPRDGIPTLKTLNWENALTIRICGYRKEFSTPILPHFFQIRCTVIHKKDIWNASPSWYCKTLRTLSKKEISKRVSFFVPAMVNYLDGMECPYCKIERSGAGQIILTPELKKKAIFYYMEKNGVQYIRHTDWHKYRWWLGRNRKVL